MMAVLPISAMQMATAGTVAVAVAAVVAAAIDS
jgi:hypothetical protein